MRVTRSLGVLALIVLAGSGWAAGPQSRHTKHHRKRVVGSVYIKQLGPYTYVFAVASGGVHQPGEKNVKLSPKDIVIVQAAATTGQVLYDDTGMFVLNPDTVGYVNQNTVDDIGLFIDYGTSTAYENSARAKSRRRHQRTTTSESVSPGGMFGTRLAYFAQFKVQKDTTVKPIAINIYCQEGTLKVYQNDQLVDSLTAPGESHLHE